MSDDRDEQGGLAGGVEYDPLEPPDPVAWLELGEGDRIDSVVAWHRRVVDDLPSLRLHATLHVVVENQLAMRLGPVEETVARLMEEGLDRHQALHAVGSVVADHLYELMTERAETGAGDPNETYYRRLRELTAARWRETFE